MSLGLNNGSRCMRNRVLALVLVILPFIGIAQKEYKLIEQSSKQKPAWLLPGYDYHNVYMKQAMKVADLEEAQDIVMTSLLNEIASSVAVQVEGETEEKIDWTTAELNGKTKDEYMQVIKSNTTIKIAKMPALQGISITKADIYWEKYINKNTKETCYDYYMLYPFSTIELQELIDEYNAQEKAINDKIDGFRDELPEITNVDEALDDIAEMKIMIKDNEDDVAKCDRLRMNISLYKKFIDEIYVDVIKNSKELILIQLKHDEKVIKTKSLPQIGSQCARDFSRKHNGNIIEITFNSFDCYEQDNNYIEVRFSFGDKKIKKRIPIVLE